MSLVLFPLVVAVREGDADPSVLGCHNQLKCFYYFLPRGGSLRVNAGLTACPAWDLSEHQFSHL